MKRVNVFLVAFVALVVANPLWAQGMHQQMGMRGMMQGQGRHMMQDSDCPMMGAGGAQGFFLNQAEELGLNKSQIDKLEKFKSKAQKPIIRKEADLKIARLELSDLMKDSKVKRSDLEAQAKKVEELRSDIRLTEFKAKLDARAVLTPEQLQKVQTAKKPCMDGMMSMRSEANDGGCPMMKSNANSKDDGEHEKHHPKG